MLQLELKTIIAAVSKTKENNKTNIVATVYIREVINSLSINHFSAIKSPLITEAIPNNGYLSRGSRVFTCVALDAKLGFVISSTAACGRLSRLVLLGLVM